MVIPLDAVGFHWSHIPLVLQIVGAILVVGFMPLAILTFRENSFLSGMVRDQRERRQTVIATGPYHTPSTPSNNYLARCKGRIAHAVD